MLRSILPNDWSIATVVGELRLWFSRYYSYGLEWKSSSVISTLQKLNSLSKNVTVINEIGQLIFDAASRAEV